MKKIALSVCAGILLAVVACNSGPSSSDPRSTLMSFFKALSKKDLKEARKYATKESESMFSMMEMGMNMAKTMKTEKVDDQWSKMDEANVEIGEAVINGDKATVPVISKKDGESSNFILKKEDGAWKVAFDKSSMSEMAGEKIKENGGTMALDSLSKALQELDTDSLKAKMEQGLQALDSLKKAMKQ